jgi:WD40 repeat protein
MHDPKMWSLSDGKFLREIECDECEDAVVAASADGKLFATVASDRSIELWSLPDGERFKRTFERHAERVSSLAISPDGKQLASASQDGAIKLWSLPDGVLLKTLAGHLDRVSSLAFSPDGKQLISGSLDRTIRFWSLPDGTLLATLGGQPQPVLWLAMSLDGRRLVSLSDDPTISIDESFVRLWSLPDRSLLKSFDGTFGKVSRAALSADGEQLVTGDEQGAITLWSLGGSGIPHQSHRYGPGDCSDPHRRQRQPSCRKVLRGNALAKVPDRVSGDERCPRNGLRFANPHGPANRCPQHIGRVDCR